MKDSEYASFRTEILGYSNQVIELSKFSFTITSAFLGWGLTTSSIYASVIVLTPLLFLAPAFILSMSARQNAVRIASYLRAFCEEKEYPYEARLTDWRKLRKGGDACQKCVEEWNRQRKTGETPCSIPSNNKKLHWASYQWGVTLQILVQSIVCFVAGLIFALNAPTNRCFYLCIVVLVALIYVIIAIRSGISPKTISIGMGGDFETQCYSLWKYIKDNRPEPSTADSRLI